jgi:hypothetical protein
MEVEDGFSLARLSLWFLVNKYLKLRQDLIRRPFNSFTVEHRYHRKDDSRITNHISEPVSKMEQAFNIILG